VVHPFIEAEFAKSTVRALARFMGLGDLADLPSQPCLSSRIETALELSEADLAFVDALEQEAADLLPAMTTIRCRITRDGVVLELGSVVGIQRDELIGRATDVCRHSGRRFVGIKDYVRGSAFVRALR
jgi:uncharacterized protein